MSEHEAILRKAGTALIVVGLIDIAFMAYCIANEIGYSSSFNIFAVIAGILLYRGGLKTATVVIFFSAFFLTCMGGLLFIFPLFMPPDLLLTQIKLNPFSSAVYCILAIFLFLFLVWVLKNLTSPAVQEAMTDNGINPKSFFIRPRSGVFCGILLLAILGSILPLLLQGETAEMAKAAAQKQVGDGYKFSVSTINIQSSINGKTQVYAVITAYNKDEIKQLEVQFEK